MLLFKPRAPGGQEVFPLCLAQGWVHSMCSINVQMDGSYLEGGPGFSHFKPMAEAGSRMRSPASSKMLEQ